MGVVKRLLARHPFVLLPFLFYGFTAARSIGMSDTAILIFDIQNLDLSARVNSHNLTVLLGRVFSWLPLGSLALRGNLMAVFSGGLAIALFYMLVVRCTGSRLAAALTASLLMVSHSMWWHSTIAESYAINACLVIVALHLLESYRETANERDVLALIGLAGIAVFQHAQLGVIGLAALVVAGGHIRRSSPGRFVLRAALVAAVALAPYALVLAHDALQAGSLGAALGAAAGGEFRGIMFDWAGGLGIADTIVLTLVQFPSLFLIAVCVGLPLFLERWRWSASTVAVLTMFVVNTAFFSLYHTWDRFAFLLISFVILAFWGGFAVAQVLAWAAGRSQPLRITVAAASVLSLALPPLVYPQLGSWRGRPGSVWAMRFNQDEPPHTVDVVRYNAIPAKSCYNDIAEFSGLLFEKLPPEAVYVTDDAFFYTLQYYTVYEGRRPDLGVGFINAWGFSGWGLAPDELSSLLDWALAAGLPVFLERLDAPFDAVVSARGYAFERFPLDDRHFVHRLVTEGMDATAFTPSVRGLAVVRERGEPVVRLELEPNRQSFPVVFRWIAPDGQARFSSPLFVVPAGSASFAWVQDRRGVITPGEWRVEARVGATRVASARFVAP